MTLVTELESNLRFYRPETSWRLDDVVQDMYERAAYESGHTLDTDHEVDVALFSGLTSHLGDLYVYEVISKQATENSLNGPCNYDEAIEAMADDDKYDELAESIYDFISYNDAFGSNCGGAEWDFMEDVLNRMSEQQLFYLKRFEDAEGFLDESETFNVFDGNYKAVNSPLQEVW